MYLPGAGEPSGGGFEADHAAERRRHPDGASTVDAERDGAEPRTDHGGGAAGGSPGHLADVVGVPRRPAQTRDTLSARGTCRGTWPYARAHVDGRRGERGSEKGLAYPWWGLMPLVPAPSSCMLVLPARTAPHARSCATHAASASQGLALPSHRVPPVVG
jgi:hypothetical protein